jgi:hypothetical protein
MVSIAAVCLVAPCAWGQLLDGEFGDIDLGRPLVETRRFPTLAELRAAVCKPEISAVLMFKLYGDSSDHYLPVWSADGKRLAFQRSNVQERLSRLLLFPTLSQLLPSEVASPAGAYDYMFRWGKNSDDGYVFARILPDSPGVHLLFSSGGEDPVRHTQGQSRHLAPDLYQRTDGIWRLAYERDGRLMHEAFKLDEVVESPLALGSGGSPQWSSDGFRLLLVRARGSQIGAYDVALLNLKSDQEIRLSTSPVVRSPTWSPDEAFAAFYAHDAGDNKPWRIEVAPASGGKVRVIARDVVVNSNFDSASPAWQPDGKRLWFFSHEHRQQAYYPLVVADREAGSPQMVDYPRRVTTPNDLAIHPLNAVPEMALVAHDGPAQDLFVLFLNHY